MNQAVSQTPAAAPARAADLGPEVRLSKPRPQSPPLFIEPVGDGLASPSAFLDWIAERRDALDRLIVEHGGIVLRGFPVRETEDFSRLMALFPAYAGGYRGGWSPRRQLASGVLESTTLDAHLLLPVHSEMAYMRDYPPRIAFFCRVAAESGGETIIADLRRVTARLPDELKARVAALGVRYVRNYAAPGTDMAAAAGNPDNIPWDHGFATRSRAEVDEACAGMGMETIWNPDGSLTVVSLVEPLARHPLTGETIWRSTVHSGGRISAEQAGEPGSGRLPTGSSLGDGTRLTPEEVATIKAVMDEATLAWPWQPGDVMILDNLLVAHGRNPYVGEREVQVSLLGR